MREVMRLVILKVMRQNDLDVLVNPTTTIPPARIGYARQPVVNNRSLGRFPTSANLGIPEITVPAGFNAVVFEPEYTLNAAKDDYVSTANEDRPSTLQSPMPVGISFWAGPGRNRWFSGSRPVTRRPPNTASRRRHSARSPMCPTRDRR